jgi:hypothetical protein
MERRENIIFKLTVVHLTLGKISEVQTSVKACYTGRKKNKRKVEGLVFFTLISNCTDQRREF